MSRDSHQRVSQPLRGLGIWQPPRWQPDITRTCHPEPLMSCNAALSPSFHTLVSDILAKLSLTVDSATLVGKVTLYLHSVIPYSLHVIPCNIRFYSNSFAVSFYYAVSPDFFSPLVFILTPSSSLAFLIHLLILFLAAGFLLPCCSVSVVFSLHTHTYTHSHRLPLCYSHYTFPYLSLHL